MSVSKLTLKRQIVVKAVVTPKWKEEAQKQLQLQIERLDKQMQQLDVQGQKKISEIQKQADQPSLPNIMQQIDGIKLQVNQKQREILQQKNQILQQLQQVQDLEMEVEVNQGQMESFFEVEKGTDLVKKLQLEILLRDGVIEEIRGEV